MAKHFLYLTNERLTCLVWHRGQFIEKESFAARDPFSPEFERYLAKHRSLPAHLLLDLTEEDFRVETVPHLRGNDQRAVLNRKLGQIYRNTPFRHALIQGRNEDGRRDDRVLYHGITNPDLVRPWLSVLLKLSVPVEGISSAPVLSGHLLKALDVFFPHTLLVSLVAGEGLRQTYFQNKQVKFSRLTPLERGEDASFGQQIAEETSRTWQYLDSLRYFSADDTLEVCLLVHPRDHKAVSDAIRDFPLLQHRILSTEDVAQVLKLKPPPLTSEAEEIFVHLFAGMRIENQFAQDEETRDARLRRVGFGLHMASGGVLLASLGTTAVLMVQAGKLDNETQVRDAQAKQMTDRYSALLGQMQIAGVSSETSRDTAAFAAAYLQPLPSPQRLLVDVSQVLARFPDVRLAQIAWQTSNDDKAIPALSPTGAGSPLPLRSESKAAPPVVVVPSAQTQLAMVGNRYQIVLIEGAISTFPGDYRGLLERVDGLVAALASLSAVQSSVVQSPLDIRTTASIKANLTGKPSTETGEGRFTIRIVRDMRAEAGKS